jgi:hypothetical protein
MDESMSIFRTHIIARIPDWLITSPILASRKKTVDPAQNRGTLPNSGDDMRQSGNDMVRVRSFLPPIIAGKVTAIFSRSVQTTHRHSGLQTGAKARKQGECLIGRLTHIIASFDF